MKEHKKKERLDVLLVKRGLAESREKAKACLSNEQKAWNSLMKVRKSTSRRLQGRIKSVYDNATYRLQRYHLIQLKNATSASAA